MGPEADGPLSGAWNWGVIGAIIVVAAGAIRSIARAFSAPDALDARFTDRQRRARAGLEADHIIPSLARLLTAAAVRLPAWAVPETSEEELAALLQDELSATEYLDQLRGLGELARDYERITTSYAGAERSARVRGVAGILTLLSLVYPAFWLAAGKDSSNVLLWAMASAAILSATAMLGAWINETRLRTRLVRLCRAYERSS